MSKIIRRKSGFTLVELSVSVLIISCILMILIYMLRSNLSSFNWGQKHMSFNHKKLMAARQIFYDLKSINPSLHLNKFDEVVIRGEEIEEFNPTIVTITKKDKDHADSDGDQIDFFHAVYGQADTKEQITYVLKTKEKRLARIVTDRSGRGTVKYILDNVSAFELNTDEIDRKQLYVSFSVSDPENGVKEAETVTFAVRLETDMVYVKVVE